LVLCSIGVVADADDQKNTPASTPLSKSVTLYFEIAGAGQSFSITTATTAFHLNSEMTHAKENGQETEENSEAAANNDEGKDAVSSEVTSESKTEFKGSVAIDEATGLVLVTCHGSIRESKDSEEEADGTENESTMESSFRFDASTRVRPGQPKLLVQSGPVSIKLTVDVAE
jgi:hypothetical protein